MKQIKKTAFIFFALLPAFMFAGAFSGCIGGPAFNVRFVAGNGAEDVVRRVVSGKVTLPEDPVRKGYTFGGWFYSSDGGITLADSFVNAGIVADQTVYAHWYTGSILPSLAPGMYDAAQSLTLSGEAGRPVFYTTDGSDPVVLKASQDGYTETGSTRYFVKGSPIELKNRATERPRLSDAIIGMWNDKLDIGSYTGSPPNYNRGTVVKATVLKENGKLGDIWTGTYIVWPNFKEEFDLPVISIALPQAQLFAKKNDNNPLAPDGGIYRYYGDDIEYTATFEYFDKDKNLVFFRDGGLKTSGGKYAGGAPMKTFNVNLTRGKYNEPVNYPIWGNVKRGNKEEPITAFSRFRLRNDGGSYAAGGYSQVLSQSLASCLNPAVAASVYTAVYLNGDFWGVYSMEEHYDDRYLSAHYNEADRRNMIQVGFNSNCDNVPEIEDGNATSAQKLYQEMYEFARDNDFTSDAVYQKFITEYLDPDDYIDTVLCHIFFNNSDFPGNNNRMWRAEIVRAGNADLDGRWHQMLYDFDRAFSDDWNPSQDMLAHFLGERMVDDEIAKLNPGWATLFFRRLIKNESFRDRLLDRAVYFYNYVLEPTRFSAHVDEIYHALKTMQPSQNSRWGLSVDLDKVRADYKAFAAARRDLVMTHFSAHYSPNDHTAFLTLNGDPVFDGEKNNPTCAGTVAVVPVELTLTAEEKLDATKIYWTAGAGEFSEGIFDYSDPSATKQLKLFSGMRIRLDNADAGFLRYEVSTDGGATYQEVSERQYTLTAGADKITVKTVYE